MDDVKQGDLWFFPTGYPHSIQGLAPDGCEFLLVFDDGAFSEYDTVLLADWMRRTPLSVLAKNFNVSRAEPAKAWHGVVLLADAKTISLRLTVASADSH